MAAACIALRRIASLPMQVAVLGAALSIAAGCATRPVDPEIVAAWSQHPEERGKLPVGRVMSAERFDKVTPKTDPATGHAWVGRRSFVLGGLATDGSTTRRGLRSCIEPRFD